MPSEYLKKYNESKISQLPTIQFLKFLNDLFTGKCIYETKRKEILYYGEEDE